MLCVCDVRVVPVGCGMCVLYFVVVASVVCGVGGMCVCVVCAVRVLCAVCMLCVYCV